MIGRVIKLAIYSMITYVLLIAFQYQAHSMLYGPESTYSEMLNYSILLILIYSMTFFMLFRIEISNMLSPNRVLRHSSRSSYYLRLQLKVTSLALLGAIVVQTANVICTYLYALAIDGISVSVYRIALGYVYVPIIFVAVSVLGTALSFAFKNLTVGYVTSLLMFLFIMLVELYDFSFSSHVYIHDLYNGDFVFMSICIFSALFNYGLGLLLSSKYDFMESGYITR